MILISARAFALSLPATTEEPHFDMASFRVRGKIFATVPPDDEHLHVFVDEGEVRAAVAEDPAAFEPLLWGQRLEGAAHPYRAPHPRTGSPNYSRSPGAARPRPGWPRSGMRRRGTAG